MIADYRPLWQGSMDSNALDDVDACPPDDAETGALRALAEMLRQLYAAQQARAADILLERCPRSALERLLRESAAFMGSRVRYVLEDNLRHRKAPDMAGYTVLRAIASVLNAWLHDGRRLAIRAVLREFSPGGLRALVKLPELDHEVASMTGDFTGGNEP